MTTNTETMAMLWAVNDIEPPHPPFYISRTAIINETDYSHSAQKNTYMYTTLPPNALRRDCNGKCIE